MSSRKDIDMTLDKDTKHNIKVAQRNCRQLRRLISKIEYMLSHGTDLQKMKAVVDTYLLSSVINKLQNAEIDVQQFFKDMQGSDNAS